MRWAEAVLDALAGVEGDVVAVGHSMGGMALPALASIRPITRMVFLGAMVPMPGRVFVEYLGENPDAVTMPMDGAIPDDQGHVTLPYEMAREYFYADCAEQVSRAAHSRLRHQELTVFLEPYPIGEWPDAPSSYIVMTEDRAVGQAWSRRVAVERLGGAAIELPGSHSPFYSRPAALAELLISL